MNATAAKITDFVERLKPIDEKLWGHITAFDIDPVPADVRRYMHRQTAALDAVADFLVRNPPPVVSVHLRDIRDDTFRWNGIRAIQLQKIVLTDAVVRYADGDRAGAERMLDVSWRLNEELRRTPLVDAQALALAVLRMQLRVLRALDVDADRWRPRLREHDYRVSMIAAHEARTYLTMASVHANLYADPGFWKSLGANVPAPARLFAMLNWFLLPSDLEANREALIQARREPLSDHVAEDLERAFQRGGRRWTTSLLGKEFGPVIEPFQRTGFLAFETLTRTTVERELTERVLMARAARKNNGGRWPKSIDGLANSEIENRRWIYSTSGSTATIRIDPPIA